MKQKNKSAGGKREGAGRKLKYGEETVKVNYRIPLSKKDFVNKWIMTQLKKWIKK